MIEFVHVDLVVLNLAAHLSGMNIKMIKGPSLRGCAIKSQFHDKGSNYIYFDAYESWN